MVEHFFNLHIIEIDVFIIFEDISQHNCSNTKWTSVSMAYLMCSARMPIAIYII